MFHLFKVYSYLNYRVNFAVDTIQHARFIHERRFARKNLSAIDSTCASQENQQRSNRSAFVRWVPAFVDNFIWMLEYNQLNLFHLFLFSTNFLILAIYGMLLFCYLIRPRERDPHTGDYLDPVLRFFESIYLIEIFSKTDATGALNRISLVICCLHLVRRVESLYLKLKNSKINRFSYNKLDAIQMNVAVLDKFAVKSIRDLWSLLLLFVNHKCNRECILRTNRGRKIKLIANKLIKHHKIDWLYYQNLIDFSDCYQEAEKYLVTREWEEPLSHSLTYSLCHKRTFKSLPRRFMDLCKIGADQKLKSKQFVPRPYHRLHPRALLSLIAIYLMAVLNIGYILLFSSVIHYYPILRAYGFDSENVLATFPLAWVNSVREPKNLAGLISASLYVFVIGVNLTDTATLVHNAVVELSRANLVTDMFKVEVNFHLSHVRAFSRYLIENKLNIGGLSEFHSNLGEYNETNAMADESSPTNPSSTLLSAHGSEIIAKGQMNLEQFMRERSSDEPTITHRDVSQLIKVFKRSSIDQVQLIEFNENIRYLLNLVKVLQNEQTDLRTHFTWSLNSSVIAGTVGLSMASSALYDSNSLQESLTIFMPVFAIILPLFFSLFMGASSEGSFLKITETIRPLMVNELKLVDETIVENLRGIYQHLSAIENRSFMILGNLPLTFGSLTSVSHERSMIN